MSEPKAVPRNVSMYPEQWEVVDAVDNRYGFRNSSTALRFIVSEYQRMSEDKNERESVNGTASNQ